MTEVLSKLPTLPMICDGQPFVISLVVRGDDTVSLSMHTQSQDEKRRMVIEDIGAITGEHEFLSVAHALDFIHDAIIGNRVRQEADRLRSTYIEA